MSYELIPHNGKKSFYGKAIVNEYNGKKVLTSYKKEVAAIDKDGSFMKLWRGYSNTTMTHVNSFRIENGLQPISKKQWLELETINYNPLVDMIMDYNRHYTA